MNANPRYFLNIIPFFNKTLLYFRALSVNISINVRSLKNGHYMKQLLPTVTNIQIMNNAFIFFTEVQLINN